MIKGPGRTDCFMIGVSYGYMECLRRGPDQAKLRRKFESQIDRFIVE